MNVFSLNDLKEKRINSVNQKLKLLRELKIVEEQIIEVESLMEKIHNEKNDT